MRLIRDLMRAVMLVFLFLGGYKFAELLLPLIKSIRELF